jgi:hypothetical protein
MLAVKKVCAPMTLSGFTMAAVNRPLVTNEPLVICSQGWLDTAVHGDPAPVNATVTSCGGVTDVSAASAAFLVATKRTAAGLALMVP